MPSRDRTTTRPQAPCLLRSKISPAVRAAGAQVVEANLSCPNARDREGQVYCDPELAGRVAAALRRGARDLPILLKAGPIEDDKTMAAFVRAIAPAASGVVMINAPRRLVQTADGGVAFGPGREHAGIKGVGIHPIALYCLRRGQSG
jgi:dihydroorotate dehydrogenase